MIKLFNKDEIAKPANEAFTSLGIGVLTDAVSCVVSEELNGAYELEMEYPITGKHFKDIQNDCFIVTEPNDIDEEQPFRIYKITRPIGGIVTIYAEHISYMASKVPVKAFTAVDLDDVCTQISQKKLINSKFNLIRYDNPDDPVGTKNNVPTEFSTKIPYSLRSLVAGSDGSILDVYGGEYLFDKFDIILKNRRGKDRDFVIRYSKNMIDLEHEVSTEKSFNGVCPYYNSTTTETKVSTAGKYKEIYLSSEATTTYTDPETGQPLHPKEWLSYNSDGIGFVDKIVSLSVTNIIATEGDLYNHLVRAKYVQPTEEGSEKANYFIDVTYNLSYIDSKCTNEFGKNWLMKDDSANPTYWDPTDKVWNPEGLPIGTEVGQWNPNMHYDLIFRVYTEGDKKYHCYLWKETSVGSGQFAYVEATDSDGVNQYLPTLPSVGTVSEEKDNILTYEGDIIYLDEKRCVINPEYANLPWPPYPENPVYAYPRFNFLIEVSEQEQYQYNDDRFVPKKAEPTDDYIVAYIIEGAEPYSKVWLTDEDDVSGDPLIPINNKYYKVMYSADKYVFVYWSAANNRYILNSSIIPESGQIYKVPTLETYIDGYPIEGAKNYTEGWLSATEGSTTPLVPVDQKGYLVYRDDGKLFYYRWNKDSNEYVQMNDRRYTYTNVEWGTVQNTTTYFKHSTDADTILTLDLTEKFEETPKEGSKFQKKLYDSTRDYIDENGIGKVKETVKVSFVKLSSSTEYAGWKQLEKVYLGDSVHIIYEDSGVNVVKQVIKTEYNVLKESYDSIELGEKSSKFTDNALVEGDDISSLTNDKNYANIVTVTNLVAQKITADYIKAVNAEITEATISTLTSDSISATLIHAEQFEIDNLVAELLVADDAAVRRQLTVGAGLIVSGEINVKSGSIKINGTTYLSTQKAYINPNAETSHGSDYLLVNLNDTEPLDPSKYADDTIYEVYNSLDVFEEYVVYKYPEEGHDGEYIVQYFDEETLFEVDRYGKVTASDLNVTGGEISISAKTVNVRINPNGTAFTSNWLEKLNSHSQWEVIVPDIYTNYRLTVTDGENTNVIYYLWKNTASAGMPEDYKYVESEPISTVFHVDRAGNITANSVVLDGDITARGANIGDSRIEYSSLSSLNVLGNIYLGDNVVKAYERTGAIISTTTISEFGAERTYKRLDIFGTILQQSNLVENTDYRDEWYESGHDEEEYSNSTTFFKDRVIYISLDIKEYLNIKTVRQSSTNYTIYINNEYETISNMNYTTPIANKPQVIQLIMDGDTEFLEIRIYRYSRDINWLSDESSSGDPLTPAIGRLYIIDEYASAKEFYKWDATTNKYEYSDDIMYIGESGVKLLGIESTYAGTKIGGFTISDYTLVSSNQRTKEIGLSSDLNSVYAIWAGPEDDNYQHPFSVTNEGELHATKGTLANIIIENDKIYTEDKETPSEDTSGFYLGPEGFAFTAKPGENPTDNAKPGEICLRKSRTGTSSYLANTLLVNTTYLSHCSESENLSDREITRPVTFYDNSFLHGWGDRGLIIRPFPDNGGDNDIGSYDRTINGNSIVKDYSTAEEKYKETIHKMGPFILIPANSTVEFKLSGKSGNIKIQRPWLNIIYVDTIIVYSEATFFSTATEKPIVTWDTSDDEGDCGIIKIANPNNSAIGVRGIMIGYRYDYTLEQLKNL